MNKKHIIIFGTLILLLIIILGGSTYYKQQKNISREREFTKAEFFHSPISLKEDQSYLIWCRDLLNDEEYDCSSQKVFNPKEIIGVSVDLAKLPIIYDNPYFFCYETSLEENREGVSGKKCLPFSSSEVGNFISIFKNEELIFTNNQTITLIKLMIYPNDNFSDDESVTAIDLKAQIIQ